MEMNNNMNENDNNLYKYSKELNLVNFIKENKNENNQNQTNSDSAKNNEFLIELAHILENQLKINIRLHQKGFEIYKEKILSEKNLILNSINKELKNSTISQLIDLLTKMKDDVKNANTPCFNIGQKKDNNKFKIDQNLIESMNNIFSEDSNNNNNNGNMMKVCQFNYNKDFPCLKKVNNNMNGINANTKLHPGKFDPRKVYRSPSPYFSKKHESKIIEENKNVNNQINFYEDQKIND